MRPLNIVFAGTPEFGLPCLNALKDSSHTLKAIYTQPDRPAGRGRALMASAVKCWAQTQGLPVYQPMHFKDEESLATLKALKPDIFLVIAYGLILPESVLSIPRLGAINVHASLLPRWRGASPIQHAIWYGDSHSGVSIMQMDKGMDTGAVFTEASCPLDPNETSGTLHDKLAALAAAPLLATLDALARGEGSIQAVAQDPDKATYAPKIQKKDAKIDWQQTAFEVDRLVRAFHPWPIAFTEIEEKPLRIHLARPIQQRHGKAAGTVLQIDTSGCYIACKSDVLCIQKVQFEGGKVVSIADCLNANRLTQLVNKVLV